MSAEQGTMDATAQLHAILFPDDADYQRTYRSHPHRRLDIRKGELQRLEDALALARSLPPNSIPDSTIATLDRARIARDNFVQFLETAQDDEEDMILRDVLPEYFRKLTLAEKVIWARTLIGDRNLQGAARGEVEVWHEFLEQILDLDWELTRDEFNKGQSKLDAADATLYLRSECCERARRLGTLDDLFYPRDYTLWPKCVATPNATQEILELEQLKKDWEKAISAATRQIHIITGYVCTDLSVFFECASYHGR